MNHTLLESAFNYNHLFNKTNVLFVAGALSLRVKNRSGLMAAEESKSTHAEFRTLIFQLCQFMVHM